MTDAPRVDEVLAPVETWARERADVFGLAVIGSCARGQARMDSDIDLMLLVSEPDIFRRDAGWLAEIRWPHRRAVSWRDADYGVAWSRHVRLEPPCEVEFTFCGPEWAATDPIDPGTARVVSGGCRVVCDNVGLFNGVLAALP